jgi:hypothetical protein
MAQTVSQPRPAAIAAVLAQSTKWAHATRKADGREFYIVPGSTAGTAYYVDATACTCPAARNSKTGVCKHSLAVARFRAQKAAPVAPKRLSYAELMPACSNGCGDLVEKVGESCYHCAAEAVYQADRARREQGAEIARQQIAAGLSFADVLNPLAE